MKRVLAIDFGASSGRAIVGEFDGERVTMKEIHRFSNDPVILGDTMYWDVLRLFHEIKQSLIKAKPYNVESVAIDTWGVDFGLIDKDGRLIDNPVHYRDARTNGMLKEAFELFPEEDFYKATGNQFMEINTAFQLLAVKKYRPELLSRADKVLLMPDLFSYFLTGNKKAERSIASTTQLFDQNSKDWSCEALAALGIDKALMPEIVESGSVVGTISSTLCEELDIKPIKVIAVCGHDTQSALVAAPAKESDFAFLSSGTWSLLGTELDTPIINEKSLELNVTNEQGYGGKTSFLKNIIGLWLIQESRRQWIREGTELSFAELERLALEAEPFKCFIDPDDPIFTPAGNIPKRIKNYCEKTGQDIPQTTGEVMRCIYESLALKYRLAIGELEECTGKKFGTLYMIGGGTKDKFLSRLTASCCNITVSSGPVEATSLGNILIQLMAQGEIDGLANAREIVRASEKITAFEPENPSDWDEAFERYKAIIQRGDKNA
ncbi:MAG: rhamnulokinase [Ruminococcus sp.]|nr:rhamnulokinase [Ruminococcus sp.]